MRFSFELPPMKLSTLSVLGVCVGLVGLVASSQGVAEAQNRDRTGAPGSDPVCTSCHNGATSASASFEVIDPATQEVATSYTPGQEYLVRMVIAGGEAASQYGMQSTAVLADGSNAGSFSAPSGNAQLEDVDGRHIVEHNALSAANVFEVNWTAPEMGSGNADFYMSALECNGNGSTNGDGYLAATLSIPEMGDPVDALGDVPSLDWAQPVRQGATWTWNAPAAGRLVVADASGRVLLSETLRDGQPTAWPTGALVIAHFITNQGANHTWKLAAR